MKPRTIEWIEKAEGDLQMAQREMQAPDLVRKTVRSKLGL